MLRWVLLSLIMFELMIRVCYRVLCSYISSAFLCVPGMFERMIGTLAAAGCCCCSYIENAGQSLCTECVVAS